MRTSDKAPVLAVFVLAVIMLTFMPFQQGVLAQGEGESLRQEADHLTFEILELRARRKLAESEGASLRDELKILDGEIAAFDQEVQALEREFNAFQDAYNSSLRFMYKQGEMNELELLLGDSELDQVLQDLDYYRLMTRSKGEVLDSLGDKLNELDIRKRDLLEIRSKRARLAETLDIQALDARISHLEASLSEINTLMRAQTGGTVRQQPEPEPEGWTPPPPGKLMDRVPTQPPLSDFERTGITYSGYTTSYGSDFHGRSTASGVIFNMYDYTCAHRTLPFGTWLLVSFRGAQVIVQVNDRGPFVPGRVLDLSHAAAASIGLDGVQWTDFEILVPRGG